MEPLPFRSVLTRSPRRFTIFADNLPLPLPGCYAIYGLLTNKWYVGDTRNMTSRRRQHEDDIRKKRQTLVFHADVYASSIEQFAFIPLFYFLVDRKFLASVETSLINELDSLLPNGYNVFSSRHDPGWTAPLRRPESMAKSRTNDVTRFSRLPQTLNSPKSIAKRNASLRTAAVKAKRAKSQREAFAAPEFKINHAAIMRDIYARPGATEKRSKIITESWKKRREKYGPSGRPPRKPK